MHADHDNTRICDSGRYGPFTDYVRDLFRMGKTIRLWVSAGISPFAIWRPGHPPGIAGLDQDAERYADAKLWFNEGWCDFFTPKLYLTSHPPCCRK
jgi:uncharacterized lipoprotein YddW (UPF0748 family)